jgi:predicted nucleotidyltransferase
MRNTIIQSRFIEKIAIALGELNEQVAFVGGSVVSLYANDWASEDVRPTKDIDITLQIASLSQLEALREELVSKGFQQSADETVICRFIYEDILVDVMSTHAIGWDPANRWFAPSFKHLILQKVGNANIRLLSLPYFLATKFDAHSDRGSTDPRTSKDFEDIVYLLDSVVNIQAQILTAPEDVKAYLKNQFAAILKDSVSQEAIIAQLPYLIQTERFKIIIKKINNIVSTK